MVIGVTGATGFIGGHFIKAAAAAGHEVVGFSRRDTGRIPGVKEMRRWGDGRPDVAGLEVVVHLAGETIFGLWTTRKRDRILDSRVAGTRQLVAALAHASPRPAALICASAVGYYGDCGDTSLTESSAPGSGFLATVTQAWEEEAGAARAHIDRVACLRIGLVLGSDGGAWPLLRRAFRFGLGGRLGSGKQWTPWIHIDDVAGLLLTAATDPAWSGPVNGVSPTPVTNAEFTCAVARAVRRPAVLPVPAFALRLLLRDQANLFLASHRAVPDAALALGYRFAFPTLEAALADLT